MQSVGIVLLSMLAAVTYGICLDQVTARVCVEYFTVGHPPIFGTEDPTLLALGWGMIATWWVGLVLGVGLAIAARASSRPKRAVRELIRPVIVLMVATGLCALIAGIVGWVLALNGIVHLVGPLARDLPADKHVPFLADLWAHSASYIAGAVGAIVVMVRVWRSRGKNQPLNTSPSRAHSAAE
jgi:hypothetical protein